MQNTQIALAPSHSVVTSIVIPEDRTPSADSCTEAVGPADVAELTLDEMRVELSTIITALIELPGDAFTARVDLRERQHELRHAVAQRLAN